MKRIFLSILFVLFLAVSAFPATYYVDFDGGNDSANGTSTATAWKNLPGTCTTASSASWPCTYVTNTWASINAGDTINIKSGTTHDSTDGGNIRLLSTYYATNATIENPITIQRDTTWGTGAVTIDGSGVNLPGGGFGLIHIQVGGIKFDGKTTDGLVIQSSAWNGISNYNSSGAVGTSVYYAKFYNNGTAVNDTGSGASEGSIKQYDVVGGTMQYITIDGNGRHINGIVLGEDDHSAVNFVVDNAIIHNHSCGDPDSGDWAIGIKVLSGIGTVSNSTIYNNFKGADNGTKDPAVSPILKYINNTIYSNVESGLNGNGGTAIGISNVFTAYLINNIIRDNAVRGSSFYDGKMNLYFVHNVYDNNGDAAQPYDSWQLAINNNTSPAEGSTIRAYLYNNIFYKPAAVQNFSCNYWSRATSPVTDFNLYSNYNSWVQRASEYMATWGTMSPSDETYNFSYGANGPGHASGNWYTYYGSSASAPTGGALGHYHQDANSKGTGATDTTLPPFTDVTGHIYTLTAAYGGMDLSGESWYISEMGTDRAGIVRSSWDIGAYEFGDITPPTILNVTSDKPNGTYTIGTAVDIDITFSEAVTSTGNVTVTLETGDVDRSCTFVVTNSAVGSCNYIVQAGDMSADLTVKTIAGTIADQASNPMVNFTPATNLAANKAIVIDTTVVPGPAHRGKGWHGKGVKIH